MTVPTVELDNTEFGHLMFVLANAEGKGITWALINPLLMKIGGQLRNQSGLDPPLPTRPHAGNQSEASHE